MKSNLSEEKIKKYKCKQKDNQMKIKKVKK